MKHKEVSEDVAKKAEMLIESRL